MNKVMLEEFARKPLRAWVIPKIVGLSAFGNGQTMDIFDCFGKCLCQLNNK